MTETPTFSSPMQEMQYKALVEMIEKRNALATTINAATGSKDALVESIREGNDPQIAALREQIATLEEQMDALIEAAIAELKDSEDSNIDALTAEAKELADTIRAGSSYYKKLYGDEAAAALPKVTNIKSGAAKGSGGRRVRGYNVIVEVNGEQTEYENFAGAAKALSVETALLQEQFFAKAGVEKLKDAPDTVSFGMSWVDTDEDGNETPFNATITAVRTGPSGVPTKNEEPSNEDLNAIDEDALADF